LAANQYTVEYQYQSGLTRRPDLVVFINGLPIAAFEFKNFGANEVAKNIEEAGKLVETGFDYVCSHEGLMLFRKRK
jgi:type I site-specific restriction-modification system R (restriction) subunit